MISKRLMAQIGNIKKMNTAQITSFILAVYRNGFEDGLQEGESEFDDALILSEEEAADYFTPEAVERALSMLQLR